MSDVSKKIVAVVNKFANAPDQDGFDSARVEAMATIQMRNSCTENTVIVRAYRDRPVRLHALMANSAMSVYRSSPDQSMGWPIRDAYSDEPGVFERLQSAWESGDQEAIAAAWNDAKPLAQT